MPLHHSTEGDVRCAHDDTCFGTSREIRSVGIGDSPHVEIVIVWRGVIDRYRKPYALALLQLVFPGTGLRSVPGHVASDEEVGFVVLTVFSIIRAEIQSVAGNLDLPFLCNIASCLI